MKIIYLTLFLLGVLFQTFAQKLPKDTLKTTSLTASEAQKLLPQITPKSPNVASLEKFSHYPVNLYSGLVSIEIPLYEIKVGNISIPVKLSYHASGNKVNENASWVGLGWSVSCDYTLSRNIRGRADETDYSGSGSLLQNNLPNLSQFTSCLTTTLKSDYNQYVNFGKDAERDIFTYRTPTKSNSFVILPNQTGVIWQESDNSLFNYSAALQNPTITDENGTKYFYDYPEITTSSLTGAGATSAWHLKEIKGIKATDRILFTYQTAGTFNFTQEINQSEIYHTDISGTAASTISGGYQSLYTSTDSPGVNAQLLTEIVFPMGKVVFVPSTSNRQDGLGKFLEFVEIYGYNISTNTYSLIKKYKLNYSYKTRSGGSGAVVLFLDKVDLMSSASVLLGSYTMSYQPTALPNVSSYAKDYWGYYNAQSLNTTLIPAYSFTAQTYIPGPMLTFNGGGANREVNALTADAWMLRRMTYPTGGYSTFEFESNRYADAGNIQRLAGGLRIKQIITDDNTGVTLTKTYKYGTNESGNGTLRSQAFRMYPTVQRIKAYSFDGKSPEYFYNVRSFSSAHTYAINANEGSTVTYPVVTEYEDSGTGDNGKTVYSFKDDASDDLITIPSNGKSAQKNRHWNRGQLLSKISYGKDGKKKYEQTNTYTTLSTGNSAVIGYLIGQSEIRINSDAPNSLGCYTDDDSYDPINPITWNYGLVKLSSSQEKYYDNDDDSKFSLKKVETTYNSTHFQPYEIKEYVSNNIMLGKLLWYPSDFAPVPTTTTVTDEVKALRAMQQANVLSQVIEEIDYRRDQLAPAPPDAPYLLITGGKYQTFEVLNSGSTLKAIVPKTVSILECVWNTFLNANNSLNFTASRDLFNPSTHPSSIPKNSNYKPRMYLDSYDSDGNLLTYHPSDDVTTRLVYGSSSNSGLSFVYPLSETKNYLTSNPNNLKSLTTNFEFSIPHLGMDAVTDPSGLKTSFEYDTFGRLLLIKDHNGKIVKKYQYQF